jgi:hypothetical protein
MSNLKDEILEELGTQMQSEIDKEILWGMLVGLGWTRVLLPRFNSREHSVDVVMWLEENCKNPYERKGSEVIFENPSDAVNFILKWL